MPPISGTIPLQRDHDFTAKPFARFAMERFVAHVFAGEILVPITVISILAIGPAILPVLLLSFAANTFGMYKAVFDSGTTKKTLSRSFMSRHELIKNTFKLFAHSAREKSFGLRGLFERNACPRKITALPDILFFAGPSATLPDFETISQTYAKRRGATDRYDVLTDYKSYEILNGKKYLYDIHTLLRPDRKNLDFNETVKIISKSDDEATATYRKGIRGLFNPLSEKEIKKMRRRNNVSIVVSYQNYR